MQFTESLKQNYEFKRIYRRGKTEAGPFLVVYARPNRLGKNRLGITVSQKIGNAVVRNRTRRRIKEAYRLHEKDLKPGFDLVVVARGRAAAAPYRQVEADLQKLLLKLSIREAKHG